MNAKARQRAEVIFKVRSGQMTATAAAQELGISRQQYYQWEQRALQALLSSLEDQPTGRPKIPTNPEKQALEHRVAQLEQQVQDYQQKEHLRQLLNEWEQSDLKPSKKNRNDPPNPASARHREKANPPFVAPTLRAGPRPRFGAVLQCHALAPPATDRLAPVAMSRP